MRTKSIDQIFPGMVALLGIPSDEGSSYLRGAALGPARIREALHAGAMNLCAENGLDLGTEARLVDAGDLQPDSGDAMRRQVQDAVAALLDIGVQIVALGGDHAITYPIVRAHAARYSKLNILHLDAHPDLYDELDGDRYSHACPFARIMEESLAGRLVQVGIRTANPHQREQARRFGVEMIEMRNFEPGLDLSFDGPVYLSLDLDALDPACAPGVSHPEPGGLSTRQVIEIIQDLDAPVVGADIVELNPLRDPSGATAVVALKLLKEIAARMLERSP